jgi:hypothetical protein
VPIGQDVFRRLGLIPRPLQPLLLLLPRVVGDVRNGFLDEPDDLLLGARVEDVAALAQQRLEVLGHVAAGDVYPADAARHGKAFVDRHGVGDAIARVEHDARRPAGGVQREHGLDRGVKCRDVEGLEEDLGGNVAIAPGIEGWFRQQDGVLLKLALGHVSMLRGRTSSLSVFSPSP